MQLEGRRVTVMGLGHFGGGVAAARWLARSGAVVTVTDLASEKTLLEPLRSLAGVQIANYRLGGHRDEDFRHADLVVVNPAVRPENPFLQVASAAGVPLTSEMEIFLAACPARVIGVTGTNGKSTTAAMTAAILRADGRRVHLGGNIGRSLLGSVDRIAPDDWVVLEISSFQLRYLSAGTRFPEAAVVTNCAPNHLDWHGTFANYAADKQRILTGQKEDGLAVLNTLDPEVATWAKLVPSRQLPPLPLDEIPELSVPGRHNRVNAACAAAAALGIGCAQASIVAGLASYRALRDRLELVAVIGARKFYNDSSSTTPESTIAALDAIEGPMWLLAGGSDKGADFGPMAEAIAARATGAALYGAVREGLRTKIVQSRSTFPCTAVDTMDDGLRWCWRRSRPGESIVLSPGCASKDQFQNYRARGEHFVGLLRVMAGERMG
ncbi:MAG: UDP-N-acetylmuramoyl-L-alanine--D-glutamate ligase [Pirellulales bacterium]|nr:UDP-N-acetylmuramoyl-L-alanine--D-glutamate ligase [Pirellulales bacterium]